jgi:LacI family transcriptional regulator
MTVSRVINNKGEISETTRKRVQETIDQLGYRPSSIARGLVTDRTGTVGLVVIDNANPFFSEVARGVEDVAYAEGYNVFLCNTEEDIAREIAVLQSLEEKRVDGVILCSSRLDDDDLKAALRHYSAVVLVNRTAPVEQFGTIVLDDEKGAQIATEHLIQSGHRAIGFLAGPRRSRSGQMRVKGYRTTLEACGLTYNAEWVRQCLPVVESGQEIAQALLNDHPELTAMICHNDLTAVGALQACTDAGRRVPDDVAVVGFDNIPLAAWVTPPLTTCDFPKYQLGSQAMQMLLARINDCSQGCENIVVQPELIVRASAP